MQTQSTSDSEYREACQILVARARELPACFPSNLDVFEGFMAGHAYAYIKLLNISNTFTVLFSSWLTHKKGLSASSGWPRAINKQAKLTGELPINVFHTFVMEFFEDWNNEAL